MQSWRIIDGKMLFQIKLDLSGEFWVTRMKDQVLFTSENERMYDDAYVIRTIYNDVEARQAQR